MTNPLYMQPDDGGVLSGTPLVLCSFCTSPTHRDGASCTCPICKTKHAYIPCSTRRAMTCKCGQPVPESLVACDDKHIPKLCQDCFTSDILEPLRKERLALMFRVGQKDAEMKKLANIINPPSHKVPALYMCKCEVQGNWLDVHNHIQQENDYAKHYEHKIQVDGTWYDRDTKVVDITTKPAVRRSGTSNPRTPAAPKIGGLIRI